MSTDPPSSHFDEAERWILAAQKGDPSAWERLHRRYRPLLAFTAQAGLPSHLRGRFDPEDVIQAAFLAAFQALGRNELTSRIRAHEASKRSPRREQAEADLDRIAHPRRAEDETPSEILARTQRRTLVLEAMRRLQDEQQEILWMRDFEQRSWDEIARQRGTSTSAVRKGYAQALAALVRMLRRSDLR
jgi:RNA polymerase sigma factor (sigma-70 family)